MNNTDKDTGIYLPLVEQFYSIQGEGFHTGKAAFFIRVGGCDVGCRWCDTKFAWDSSIHSMTHINDILESIEGAGADSVVVTGGEPLLYEMGPLCRALKSRNINTYLETSGAHELSGEWDWICLSPKKNHPPVGNICSLAGELKIIIETKEDFQWAEEFRNRVGKSCKLFLQPEWSSRDKIMPYIIEYVKNNTEWSISLQSHKYMRIP